MASSKAGISALMEAEQKAADIIQAARLLKKQRKAQADKDALAEINEYKDQKQAEFETIKNGQSGGNDESMGQIASEADSACAVLRQEYEENKDKAAAMLCGYVSTGLL